MKSLDTPYTLPPLENLLLQLRDSARTEREKGTYFENLVRAYFGYEDSFRELYSDVWTYAEWAKLEGIDGKDTGIDLVAKTRGTNEIHAIQCKFYAPDYRVRKEDIDSFFTASGKKPFSHRVIIATTNNWSKNAEDALLDQQPPVSKIDLYALENSRIDWTRFDPKKPVALKAKKELRPHQRNALGVVKAGLAEADRGKLIMACGTGKTFTSLKIAEELAGKGGRVLFLVPSLSLLSQTLTEWTHESDTPLVSFAVCSDSDVGKKKGDDDVALMTHELAYPATTHASSLAKEMIARHRSDHMSVVFSTYHSIEVISRAQKDHGLGDFDLIVCDEAHRTTGATFGDEDESAFVKVHDAGFIRAKKRLYMTATPRIYADSAKATAERDNVALASMDDEDLFGKQLYVITFSEAVKRGLLVDYKVLVLSVEEAHINRRLQNLLKDEENQLKVDDAARIIGCWKALSKQGLQEQLSGDESAMKRAVAFCQVIEVQKGGKVHKVSSKNIAGMFQKVVEAYQASDDTGDAPSLRCEAEHVDGGMNATEKESKLTWLKAEAPPDTCRVLSNVRCLSEGVDVPALDAVLFLTPRNSQVDVVQSVGRVMRNAPGKNRGYIILPVVIPAGTDPTEALNDNKTYRVVWQVLQALRSHDDRFDAMVNKLDLIGRDTSKMEVIAIADKVEKKSKRKGGDGSKKAGKGEYSLGKAAAKQSQPPSSQRELEFEIGEIERAIYAKLVQKVGNRSHWEDWANDIAKIAQTHIDRIRAVLDDPKAERERQAFQSFAAELRDDLNDSITDAEIVEMLAQHLITKPVFDALFSGYSFVKSNPISTAMQDVLDILHEQRLEKERDTLESFYDSVRLRAEGIESAAGKQKIVVELYDKFFRNAFPKMTERLGIVYTPVEVVDFILHSVNHLLQKEFGQTLGSKGVHILDPFTGTGTFITRLLQSGLISPEELPYKYKHEIHANEIVLLAYYIAAINIEATYHDIVGGTYQPFEGICLTDTFQLYEKEDLYNRLLVDNSARRVRQKKLDIRVIIGNPPYSIGQKSENDNNDNVEYPSLDTRIKETYAQRSTAGLVKGLYDSYVRAIRWASDRIGDEGVVAFISGSGFIEKPAMDGMRRSLVDEFAKVHVVNLRGDIRKEMLSKGRAGEGQNVFGSGSMTGIAITFLVKNRRAQGECEISYHDIGPALRQGEKLEKLVAFRSVAGVENAGGWARVVPDAHADWLAQRDESFSAFMVLGDKKGGSEALFENFSLGITTNRDPWCYSSSRDVLSRNVVRMLEVYRLEREQFHLRVLKLPNKSEWPSVESVITSDPTRISWTHNLKEDLRRNKDIKYVPGGPTRSLYRPFTRQWAYFDRTLNERVYQMPKIFPGHADNLVICVSGVGARAGFSALLSDSLPCLDTIEKGQCFPLHLYDANEAAPAVTSQGDLFSNSLASAGIPTRRDAITNEGLAHFQAAYPGQKLTKEDLFYYVYGLLHSPDYRERYADNLTKELPRIPCVKSADDFWAFSKAGRALGHLHVKYDDVPMFPATIETSSKGHGGLPSSPYRVEKMRYGKKTVDGKKVDDKTVLIYNEHITVRGIPLESYEYVVNGKAALDWVVERQCVKTDKDSGIVNDANDWAIETMGNPKYPLELFLRVITVSLETMKIVKALPTLELP